MKKPIPCPACGNTFEIDLAKYGGKKVKCKQCQAVVAVPTLADLEDDFEVVEDNGPATAVVPKPAVPKPRAQTAGVLERSRLGSNKGAVNIALLKRHESSRAEIRNAFLVLNPRPERGSTNAEHALTMATDRLDQLSETRKTFDHLLADARNLIDVQKVSRGRYKAGFKKGALQGLFAPLGFQGSELDQAADEANRILEVAGVVDEQQIRHADAVGASEEVKDKLIKGLKTFAKRVAQEMKEHRGNKQKLDLIRKAHPHLVDQIEEARREQAECSQAVATERNTQMQALSEQLDAAESALEEGAFVVSLNILRPLLSSCPDQFVPQVLTSISICEYSSGNATSAARHIQDAVCFGVTAPGGVDEGYNDLWAKASNGLPPT